MTLREAIGVPTVSDARHLEDPDRVDVALRVEGEVRAGDQEGSRSRLVDAGDEGEAAELAGAGIGAVGRRGEGVEGSQRIGGDRGRVGKIAGAALGSVGVDGAAHGTDVQGSLSVAENREWKPVIIVEAPVVPMSPVIWVSVPWLVTPAPPPNTAKEAALPRTGAAGLAPREAVDRTAALETLLAPIGLEQAATKPPRSIAPNPIAILFRNLFIVYLCCEHT